MRDADLRVLLDVESERAVERDHRLDVLHRQRDMIEGANTGRLRLDRRTGGDPGPGDHAFQEAAA